MLKYILREKKELIIVISIILICSIALAIGIYAQVTNKTITKTEEQKQEENFQSLKDNFNTLFTNAINKEASAKLTNANINYDEIIYTAYDIKETKASKYDLNAKIPMFKKETNTTKQINSTIYDTFAQKIIDIVNEGTKYAIYNLDYVGYINENILSLVIKCTLKDGNLPQRTIIQTYNYNLDTDKLISLEEAINIKKLDKENVQNTINEEIKKVAEQNSDIETIYKRDIEDKMYKVENTENFFIGKNGYLYIIYAYGNNNYTSEKDIVIF